MSIKRKHYYLILALVAVICFFIFHKRVFASTMELDIDRTHQCADTPAIFPPNFCKHRITETIEHHVAKKIATQFEQNENAKPTIFGDDHLAISYGTTFPITAYYGETPDHEKISATLYKNIDAKHLGTQEALIEIEDPTTHLKKYLAIDVDVKDTTPPKITGQKNLTTTAGTKINLLTGITALDPETGNLPAKIIQTTPIDFNKPGSYTLVYEVADSSKNSARVKSTLTIKAKNVVRPQQITPTKNSSATTIAPKISAPSYSPNTLYLANAAIPYQNGGTASGYALINNNPNGIVSTYYGSSFNGNDGRFTHFIGHSPGIFTPVKSLYNGAPVTITNSAGTPSTYTVYQVIDLAMSDGGDGFAYPTTDAGQNLIDQLYFNQLGGEKIVLQTCMTNNGSVIRFVYAAK